MATIDCGFPDLPEHRHQELLIDVGPTIPVEIGYDPGYNPSVDPKPKLPPTLYPALIDTGASDNSVDYQLAVRIGLPVIHYEQEISGSAGRHTVPVYLAHVHINEISHTISGRFTGVQLAAGGQMHAAILGRSFLSDFTLIYDGPTGTVTLSYS